MCVHGCVISAAARRFSVIIINGCVYMCVHGCVSLQLHEDGSVLTILLTVLCTLCVHGCKSLQLLLCSPKGASTSHLCAERLICCCTTCQTGPGRNFTLASLGFVHHRKTMVPCVHMNGRCESILCRLAIHLQLCCACYADFFRNARPDTTWMLHVHAYPPQL